MELLNSSASKYFIRSLIGCFRWSGQELCWTSNVTVGFVKELNELFKLFSTEQLPDFSAVALCMAVGRKSWPDVQMQLKLVVSLCSELFPKKSPANNLINLWPQICKKLDLVHSASQRMAPSEKNCLIALVLNNRNTKYSIEDRQAIFDSLADESLFELFSEESSTAHEVVEERRDFLLGLPLENWSLDLSTSRDVQPDSTPLVRELLAFLRIASDLANNISADSVDELISTVRTGFPELEQIQPAKDVQIEQRSLREQTRELIQDLLDDPELGPVARLTKKLVSSISLPRRISRQEELTIGGFSDISNRGQVDKLILSELAHDDLTLSVRIALNEALYLRRECPSVQQPMSRWVFIDNSLPMWGIPRIYALSAVLALNATTDATTKVRCFSTRKKQASYLPSLIEVPLGNRAEVLEHFSNLGTSAEPSKHLQEFFQQAAQDTTVHDPVVVTSADTMQSKHFRMQLDKLWNSTLWMIVVHRGGNLEILKKSPQGFSSFRKIELALDEILSPSKAAKIHKPEKTIDLPAGVMVKPFPLLLSHQARAGRSWKWENQSISISDDGRLMLWNTKRRGAIELLRGLPSAEECFLVERNKMYIAILCAADGQKAKLIQLFKDRSTAICEFQHGLKAISDVVLWNSYLMIFGKDKEQHAVCMTDFPTCKYPRTETLCEHIERLGRCLKVSEESFQVLYPIQQGDLIQLAYEKIPIKQRAKQVAEFSGRFVFRDHIGSLRLENGADPFEGDSPTSARKKIFDNIVKISTDQRLGEFVIRLGQQPAVIDLKEGTFLMKSNSQFFTRIGDCEFAKAQRLISVRSPHYRFQSIGTDGTALYFQNTRGSFYRLRDDSVGHAALLSECQKPNCPMINFEEAIVAQNCKLQLAKFTSGTRAWLDWRGLIHLRSCDPTVTEVTMVLRDGASTGWTSEGDFFGDEYSVPTSKKAMAGSTGWRAFVTPILESMR